MEHMMPRTADFVTAIFNHSDVNRTMSLQKTGVFYEMVTYCEGLWGTDELKGCRAGWFIWAHQLARGELHAAAIVNRPSGGSAQMSPHLRTHS